MSLYWKIDTEILVLVRLIERMEYHTVETLYEELKSKAQDVKIAFNPKMAQYYRVIPPNFGFESRVKPDENWNVINITASSQKGTVKEACELLGSLVADHGKSVVMLCYALVKRGSCGDLEVPLETFWGNLRETDLNPFRNEPQIQAELDKLAELVDVDIVVKWLEKKLAPDRDVYLVENKYFIGLTRLVACYPIFTAQFTSKLFKPHELLPNLWICHASKIEMTRLFLPKTPEIIEDEIKYLLLDQRPGPRPLPLDLDKLKSELSNLKSL